MKQLPTSSTVVLQKSGQNGYNELFLSDASKYKYSVPSNLWSKPQEAADTRLEGEAK